MPRHLKVTANQTPKVTRKNRCQNAGRSRSLSIFGRQYGSISQAAKELRGQLSDPRLLSKTTENMIKMISDRLSRGWTPEQAFGFEPPPLCAIKAEPHPILCAGTLYPSEAALAVAFGIDYKILAQRLHRDKWPAEASVGLEPPPKAAVLGDNIVGIIYMWRHKLTGKTYIGLTIDEPRRAWQHISASKAGKTKLGTLQYSIAVEGIEAFEFIVLEDGVPGPELPGRERYWIAKMGTLAPAGYNQNRGGVIGGFGGVITVDDVTYHGFGHLAEAVGIRLGTIMGRIRTGWTIAEAAGLHDRTPLTRSRVSMNLAGEDVSFPSISAACRDLGLNRKAVERYRLKAKMSWENAIRAKLTQHVIASMAEMAVFPTQGRRLQARPA